MRIALAIFLLLAVGAVVVLKSNDKSLSYSYIITETAAATSLDPLDSDQTINMPVARMIYATPLEVDLKGDLTSSILDFFDYDEANHLMTWKVRTGLKYTDNSEMTSDDVAFAVARMVYTRPNFPVIEDIQGVKEWISSKEALKSLPKGILVDGPFVKIQFSQAQDHPLFRFCLELFSVIPKSCVDSTTNKISCKEIPGSGHYKLRFKDAREIQFEKRQDVTTREEKAPQSITFKYMSPQDAVKNSNEFDGQTVISGTELMYSIEEMKEFSSKVRVAFNPASRVAGLLINPEVEAFKDKKCRQLFAKAFRSAFHKVSGDDRELEFSLFTDLLPGYIEKAEFEKEKVLTADEIRICREKFEAQPVQWLKAKSHQNSVFVKVMEKVFSELDLPDSKPILSDTLANANELFLTGKISVVGFQTGFWAFDPAGDVQMLLTPNMHTTLNFVSRDVAAQKLIKNLKNPNRNNETFKELNHYIYDQATFNVYTHIRRFYAAKNESLLAEAPISITSPAPWQVFKVD